PVAVEDERAGGVGAAEDLRAVAGDADGDRADAGAGVAHGPREALVLSVVLVARRSAEHDQRRGDVVVGNDDGPRGAAGEAVAGAIGIGVGGGDGNRIRAQAVSVEVKAAGGIGRGVDDRAVAGNGDTDVVQARAAVADAPGEELVLPVIFVPGGPAQRDHGGGGVIVADDDAARGAAGARIAGAVAVGVGGVHRDSERAEA